METWVVKSIYDVPQDRYIVSKEVRSNIWNFAVKCGATAHLNGKHGYAALRRYINQHSEFRIHETWRRINGKVNRCDVVEFAGKRETGGLSQSK